MLSPFFYSHTFNKNKLLLQKIIPVLQTNMEEKKITLKTSENKIQKKHWLILSALFFSVFMGALDISIVSPALDNISKDLHIPSSNISWIITLYTLVYVLSVPMMSALSDNYGRKKILIINIIIFGAGSVWAIFSNNLGHLLTARGVQALGAGGIFPIASTVVGDTFPEKKRGMALAFVTLTWGAATMLGPVIGGWITQWLNWRTIFYISVFLSVFSLLFTIKFLPKIKTGFNKKFDWPGMFILGLGLLSITFVLNKLDTRHMVNSFFSSKIIIWLLIGFITLLFFIIYERKRTNPVIPLSLFRKRQLNIGLFLAFAAGVTIAALAFLPFYMMVALKIKSGLAGTLILAAAIPFFLLVEPAGLLVDKVGPKSILVFGSIVTTLGSGLLVYANTLIEFITFQIILGIGLSAMSNAPIRYLVLQETNKTERASAQGLVSLFSSFGIMVGSALAGNFMGYLGPDKTPSVNSFHHIFMMVSVTAFITMFFSIGIRSKRKTKG